MRREQRVGRVIQLLDSWDETYWCRLTHMGYPVDTNCGELWVNAPLVFVRVQGCVPLQAPTIYSCFAKSLLVLPVNIQSATPNKISATNLPDKGRETKHGDIRTWCSVWLPSLWRRPAAGTQCWEPSLSRRWVDQASPVGCQSPPGRPQRMSTAQAHLPGGDMQRAVISIINRQIAW